MHETLTTILERAECDPPLFHADEIGRWPRGFLERWLNCGVLCATTPATSVSCQACGRGHFEKVVFLDDANNTRAYISCPRYGPIRIDVARLQRWTVDFPKMLKTISRSLDCRGPIKELASNRLWHLGTASLGGHCRHVFFGRMLHHHDGQNILNQCQISNRAIVFVPYEVPIHDSQKKTPLILSLHATLSPETNLLQLDKLYVESQLADRGISVHREKASFRRTERTVLIAKLTEEMIKHVKTAHEYALATKEQTGEPRLLPRPTQRQLARHLGASQASINRCLTDDSARELRFLWSMAVDIDRIIRPIED